MRRTKRGRKSYRKIRVKMEQQINESPFYSLLMHLLFARSLISNHVQGHRVSPPLCQAQTFFNFFSYFASLYNSKNASSQSDFRLRLLSFLDMFVAHSTIYSSYYRHACETAHNSFTERPNSVFRCFTLGQPFTDQSECWFKVSQALVTDNSHC